jgi:hypothetical protein
LMLILFSLIPFLWLKTADWQAPPAWAQYATEAISLNGALTTSGTLFGLLAGLVWFNRRGGFSTAGSTGQRLLRFLVGLIGILVFYLGLKTLFGLLHAGRGMGFCWCTLGFCENETCR